MHPEWNRYLTRRGRIIRALLCAWGLGGIAFVLASCLFLTTGPFKFSGGPGMPECIECVPTDPPMNCCPEGYGRQQENKHAIRELAFVIAAAAPIAIAVTPFGLCALLAFRNTARKKMASRPSTF